MSTLEQSVQEAKQALDAHVREIIHWHFSPETGCPFWLEYAEKLDWDPRKESRAAHDVRKTGGPAWKAHPLRERAKKLD